MTRLAFAAKWCVAAMLLFATTMPLSTCAHGRHTDESYLAWTTEEASTIACFLAVPLLLVIRGAWRRMRWSRGFIVTEAIVAGLAYFELQLSAVAAGVISLGAISPGSGHVLATESLLGYIALSIVELIAPRLTRSRSR